MDYTDFQFGNFDPELDLTPDITGTTFQHPVFEDPPETGLPDNFWFNYSSTSIVTNNNLPGRADVRFSDTIKSNENRKVFNKVHLLAMRDVPALELESILKLSFSSDDFISNPLLQHCLFLLPMIGPIFWECWPYKSEEEAKIELRRRKGVKPIFARECSKCSSCRYKNSLTPKKESCSKLGLEIFPNDFSTPPPRTIISHLRIAGFLTVTNPEYSWDDVRAAVIFPQKKDLVKVYSHYVAPREVLPGARFRKGLLALNKLNYDLKNQKVNEEKDKITKTVYYPLILKTQESILRNHQNDNAAHDLIHKILLPPNRSSECRQIIESLSQDPLLWAGLRIFLPVYKTCEEVNQFLRKRNLRIPYAVRREECKHCIDNKNNLCQKLECTLITYEEYIPETDRLRAIENIGNEGSIARTKIDFCRRLEKSDIYSGLSKLRELINSPQALPVYSGAGLQDLDTLPVKIIGNNTSENWIAKKLRDNSSIIKVETTIKTRFGGKKGIAMIQDVLLMQNVYPTDSNELCLTDYQINAELKIPMLRRCSVCSNATSLYCKKYNKAFVCGFCEIPAEVNEIINFFGDTSFSVEPNQEQKHQNLDIEMENPGETLTVDVRVEKDLDEKKLWYEAQHQQLEVETPEAVEFDSPLEIELGEQGDGMILDDSLL